VSSVRAQGSIVLLAAMLAGGSALCATAPAQSDAFPAILTDNAPADLPTIETGVTYEADPPFSNPADESGRRLLDGDRPWDDWNVTVGINQPRQTVTFDFGAEYRFSRFEVRMTHEQRPAIITIAVSDTPDGGWNEAGRIVPNAATPDERGWFALRLDEPVTGRYVRMAFEIEEWGWYVNVTRARRWPSTNGTSREPAMSTGGRYHGYRRTFDATRGLRLVPAP